MKLHTGQDAPDFDVDAIDGRRVSLGAYRGRTVLLSFNRAAVCPLCNLRTANLIRRYPMYQRAGLDVISFFESSPRMVHTYLDRQRAPFPIVADPTRAIYTRFGLQSSLAGALWAFISRRPAYREAARLDIGGRLIENITKMDGRMGGLPGDFLIGPDGRVRYAYYGRDAGDFPLFRDIEAAAFGAPLPDGAAWQVYSQP